MNSPSIFKEIREIPTLYPHSKIVFAFLAYLQNTEKLKFRVYGEFQPDDSPFLEDATLLIPYIHRWTVQYRKGVLAKFYQLEEWFDENPSSVTMLSLTTYQDGRYSRSVMGKALSIPESFCLLKNSFDCLRDAFRYYLPKVPYVWVMEPHKSGYPHLHVIIFANVDERAQDTIKKLWAKKYKAGSFENGANFTVSKPEHGIKSFRNYLMKYVVKGFLSTGSKFGERSSWSAGELVFNALVWKNQWRLFGASRDLTKIMAYQKKTDDNMKWYATEILNASGEDHLVWQLHEPTGWKNHTRPYREIEKPIVPEEKWL